MSRAAESDAHLVRNNTIDKRETFNLCAQIERTHAMLRLISIPYEIATRKNKIKLKKKKTEIWNELHYTSCCCRSSSFCTWPSPAWSSSTAIHINVLPRFPVYQLTSFLMLFALSNRKAHHCMPRAARQADSDIDTQLLIFCFCTSAKILKSYPKSLRCTPDSTGASTT